jgi:hypothetical protein
MRRRLPWLVWTPTILLVPLGTVGLTVATWTGVAELAWSIAFGLLGLGSASMGAVVASRIPRNAVGWILLALGAGTGVVLGLGAYAELSVAGGHHPYPADDYADWISSWLTPPLFFGLSAFLLLMFPDGQLPSRRWRPVAWFTAAALALVTSLGMFAPSETSGLHNPIALSGNAAEVIRQLNAATDLAALPIMAGAAAALIVRLRRSRGVERQQLKWFTYTAALAGVALGLAPLTSDIAFLVGLLTLAALPLTAGLAILRYRLYDIDVVINKTLVYGALTATLGAAYLGSVLLLQLVVRPVTQGSGLAVAVSTLAVAGLFRPVRSRIQALVDRRFFRRRYDAARTLEAFGLRLRDQLDVDALGTDLQAVVHDTMQPSHVSLWLRSPR